MWWIVRNERPEGPFSVEAFQKIVASGQVFPNTLVWRSGFESWKPYAQAVSGNSTSIPPVKCELTPEFVQRFMVFKDLTLANIAFWFWNTFVCSILANVILMFLMIMGTTLKSGAAGVTVCIGVLAGVLLILSVWGIVSFLFFIYHVWRILPFFITNMTPHKAALFYLIPIFNIFWPFFMYISLYTSFSKLALLKRIRITNFLPLAMICCVLQFCYFLGALNYILFYVLIYLVYRSAVELLSQMVPEDYVPILFARRYYAVRPPVGLFPSVPMAPPASGETLSTVPPPFSDESTLMPLANTENKSNLPLESDSSSDLPSDLPPDLASDLAPDSVSAELREKLGGELTVPDGLRFADKSILSSDLRE